MATALINAQKTTNVFSAFGIGIVQDGFLQQRPK
jgi:hypothetical protein